MKIPIWPKSRLDLCIINARSTTFLQVSTIYKVAISHVVPGIFFQLQIKKRGGGGNVFELRHIWPIRFLSLESSFSNHEYMNPIFIFVFGLLHFNLLVNDYFKVVWNVCFPLERGVFALLFSCFCCLNR